MKGKEIGFFTSFLTELFFFLNKKDGIKELIKNSSLFRNGKEMKSYGTVDSLLCVYFLR